jgi:hypothetical protein
MPDRQVDTRPVREPTERSLRDLVDDYLRTCDGWREHPEHARTYMQWEDLRAEGLGDGETLPTDLAAIRQMAYEAMERS